MKNLLISVCVLLSLLTTACSTLTQSGGSYTDSSFSNLNPAPKNLTPPDYADSKSPLLDNAYLSSQADYHFTMGETLSFEGQSVRAIEEFKLTLIYDPKSVQVHLRLAAEYVRAGMITEAVEQGEIAAEMDSKSIEAHMLLGGLYTGLKMFDPARKQFEEVLNIQPGHAEASIYLGALLAEERRYEESIKYFQGLASNRDFKEHERAHYYIGRVRAEQGEAHYSEAEKAFNKALQMKADYPEAALALANLYKAQGKNKDMESVLRSFQEKFGPEREMASQLSHYYLEKEDYTRALEQLEVLDGFDRDNLNVKIQIALIMIEQKQYEAAAQRLEDVLRQAPDSDKVRYYLGAVYEEINHPELAIVNYAKIPTGSSYFAEAVIHTAHLQKTSGKIDKAITTMKEAIGEEPELPQLYAYYATLLDEKKDYKEGASMLAAAVEKFPANTQLRFFLGTMEDRLGHTTESITQMLKVLDLDKDHVQALNYLAYTYAELGKNLEQAGDLAARAMELQPNDGYILDTVGWIHFKRGETETAIRYLETAYKLKSDESIIAEHLGDAYLRYEMWQKAQRMYQRAASLESDDIRGRKIQDKLANLKHQDQRPTRSPASVGQ